MSKKVRIAEDPADAATAKATAIHGKGKKANDVNPGNVFEN